MSFTGLWPVHHAYALLRRPFPAGACSAVTAAKNKKGHLKVTFSVLWWRRREFELRRPQACSPRLAALGRPFPSGAGSAVTAAKNKKGHLKVTFSVLWWRRREFESSLSLDRPTLRFGHPSPPGAGSAVTAAKNKKGHLKVTFSVLWWRRRELNPRPPALCLWLYMLSFR